LFVDKAAVVNAASDAGGGNTLITFDASNTVLLVGMDFADFEANDVLLH
jgi:hypothetical protein